MAEQNQTTFSPEVIEKLQYYVYRLIDPRNGETFYVGKGKGPIVGAFVAHRWLDATAENFPGREDVPGRYGFVGSEAPAAIQKLYVGKRIPDEYRKKGASNPIRYTW